MIDSLKNMAYENCQGELARIIHCNVTDESQIEALFDNLLDFYDDERFMHLFWTLIQYTEPINSGIAAYYRRQEELLNEGA